MELKIVAARQAKLLSLLRRELGLSATLVKRLKWQDAFRVDGEVSHTDRMVQIGQTVSVQIEEQAEGFPAEETGLCVLYEDEWCIAVEKPSGMLVHPSPNRNEGTLANALLGYYAARGEACAVHPVTRLDRDTFGVVLFAKNAHAHAVFCELLASRGIRKVYEAAVFGAPPEDSGVIRLPIGRAEGRSLLRKADADGKEAVTEYRVLRRGAETSLLELHPVTGRTHQLRVHCAACGFPILGDPQYGSEASRRYSEAQGLNGQQLCAVKLTFSHPQTGLPVEISSRQRPKCPEFPEKSEK